MARSMYFRKWPEVLLLTSAVLLAGCQTVPGGTNGVAVSGDVAQSMHQHVFAASDALDSILSRKNVSLQKVVMDTSLSRSLPEVSSSGKSKEESVRNLAELHLVNAGPYQLVYSDTGTNRLEYRSLDNDMHVAFYVRPPTAAEQSEKHSFVITDIIGQRALSTLVRETATQSINYAQVARNRTNEDAVILSHLNSLPKVEQDREDLLGLRAMLMLRKGQNNKARPLVEQGIIRYPNSATYLSLAAELMRRADQYGDAQVELIDSIMTQRFSKAQIVASKKRVAEFLATEKAI